MYERSEVKGIENHRKVAPLIKQLSGIEINFAKL